LNEAQDVSSPTGAGAEGGTSTDHKQHGEISMKRQRGRGRKPGGGHHNNQFQPNRTLESSGPDIKVRGPASHIFERYLQLARDAAGSGDRVLSENYLQHADHYFRMVRAMQPATPVQATGDRFGADGEQEGDDEGAAEAGSADDGEATEAGEQPDVEFPEGQQPQRMDRAEGGEFRRRRGRRSRYRPDGDSAESREGGERRDAGGERRDAGEERAPRPQREGGDAAGAEGFSHGPKPAFLRD
jgi:hypothetical protein